MAQILANGIAVEVERHGPVEAPALLLIRGLGSQIIHWPDALIAGFVADGFHVITFDNRDAGLSQKFPEGGYGLNDMARDAVGVLDVLGVARAHVLGTSMGGIIAQILARIAPERVRSAVIAMSTSGAPGLPGLSPQAQARLQSKPEGTDRPSVVAHTLENDRIWGSPGFPFDPVARADLIGRAHDRCYCPEGVARQLTALMAERDQSTHLPELHVPVLVIHGSDDALIPVDCGRDIAARVPGAEMLEVDGMGHDIEGAAVGMVRAAVTEFVTRRG